MYRHIACLAPLTLMALGCAPGTPQAARTVTVTPSAAAPADGGYYATPQEIVQRAGDALPCVTYEVTPSPVNASAQVTCQDGQVLIATYRDPLHVEAGTQVLRITGADLLVGQNWTINVDEPSLLPGVRTKLGGEIRHYPAE